MVAINTFGLVVVGGDNAFHLLTVKQIEEQDNCSKQVNIAGLVGQDSRRVISGESSGEYSTISYHC